MTWWFVDQRWNWRENQALGRRLRNAKLRTNVCVEEIDYRGARVLWQPRLMLGNDSGKSIKS